MNEHHRIGGHSQSGPFSGPIDDIDLVAPRDLVVVGAGMLGTAVAVKALRRTRGGDPYRILVLDRGPSVVRDHVLNNIPPKSGVLDEFMDAPWVVNSELEVPGVINAVGGRALLWNAWCPIPSETELEGWPVKLSRSLRSYYIPEACGLLGVPTAPGLFSGALHDSICDRLFESVSRGEIRGVGPCIAPHSFEAPIALNPSSRQFYCPVPSLEQAWYEAQHDAAAHSWPTSLDVVTECEVTGLRFNAKRVVELRTRRESIPVGPRTDVVLANGPFAITRLLQNGLAEQDEAGRHLSGHVCSQFTMTLDQRALGIEVAEYVNSAALVRGMIGSRHYQVQISAATRGLSAEPSRKTILHELVGPKNAPLFTSLVPGRVIVHFVGLLEVPSAPSCRSVTAGTFGCDESINIQLGLDVADLAAWDSMDGAMEEVASAIAGTAVPMYMTPSADIGGDLIASLPVAGMFEDEGGRRLRMFTHESGVLRIGADARSSVADEDGRVHGCENLYVASTGLFPTVGAHNGTLTAVALALRTADYLTNR